MNYQNNQTEMTFNLIIKQVEKHLKTKSKQENNGEQIQEYNIAVPIHNQILLRRILELLWNSFSCCRLPSFSFSSNLSHDSDLETLKF